MFTTKFWSYTHLSGYLHRWRLLTIGKFMLRIHHIKSPDVTPFLHDHPFCYISVVLRGGYTERALNNGELITTRRKPLSVIFRRGSVFHRLDDVHPDCWTLFLCWRTAAVGEQGWTPLRHKDVIAHPTYNDAPDGVYEFDGGFRKRQGGIWYKMNPTRELAAMETWASVHQQLQNKETG